MNTYYIIYPRNFANEYSIVSVEIGNVKQEENLRLLIKKYDKAGSDIHRITLAEAKKRIAENKREAKKTNTFQNPVGAIEIEIIPEYC